MHKPIPYDRLSDWPNRSGLSQSEAQQRLTTFGPNQVVPEADGGWKTTLIDTMKDPMLWFLLIIAVLFAVVGNWGEALVLVIALVPLFGMDLYLHRRTTASTQGLMSRLAETSVVLRDGVEHIIQSQALVPGDCVKVIAGSYFPADGLLIEGTDLQVDESSLTGESWPVRKHATPSSMRINTASTTSVHQDHWGLAGTRVLTGQGWMYVVFTGEQTLYGDIAHTARLGGQARTPLQRAVTRMVKYLVVASVLACLVLAVLRLFQGHGLLDAVLSALTLAIAALPEEFPVVLTLFLGAGVYRLARRHALVRRAVAVENIGRISCICSDKTGTLTEGRLTLASVQPAAMFNEASLLVLAAHAADASGYDPLDEAILQATHADQRQPLIESFAFTEDRRKATGIYRLANDFIVASKGAPETILTITDLSQSEKDQWLMRVQALSNEGYKVIACAQLMLDGEEWSGQEPSQGFTFAGLLAFEDPLRAGVANAITACQRSGIRVVMVTGDHPGTALAIAKKIMGAESSPNVISGDALEDHLDALVQSDDPLTIVARATPAQKLVLVKALQAHGEIVAVTGDGVNDVPALQAADIGIAMGERGTQSARETAAVVLMDDNFKTIVGAIAEGRQLFTNLQRSFQYLLMIHFPLVLSAALIPMMGYPLLFLPAHIVWMELIIHPTALLVFQHRARGIAKSPTRTKPLQFFAPSGWAAIVVVGTISTAVVMGAYLRGLATSDELDHARTLAVLALVLMSATITGALSRMQTKASWALVIGAPLLSAALIYWPPMAAALHLSAMHWDDWVLAGVAAAIIGAVTLITTTPIRLGGHGSKHPLSGRTMVL